METINWSPSFSVGVRLLDQQHEQIVAMINMMLILDQNLPEGVRSGVRSETISELLFRMTKYASDHFLAEECLLEEHGYPGLAQHKAEHKAYRVNIVALCQATFAHDESVPAELLKFMREWWEHHILETDMKYRPFLAERGVK